VVAQTITFGWVDENNHLVGESFRMKVDRPDGAKALQVLVGEWVVQRTEPLDLEGIAEKLMERDDTP
jgi:hypothetical protein